MTTASFSRRYRWATRGQTPLRAVPDKRNYEHCSSSLSSLLSVEPRHRATRKRDELDAPPPPENTISLTDGAAASQAEIGSFYKTRRRIQIFRLAYCASGTDFDTIFVGKGESLSHRQAGNFPALGEEQSSPLFYQRNSLHENT